MVPAGGVGRSRARVAEGEHQFLAPELLGAEFISALWKKSRRGEIEAAAAVRMLDDFGRIAIHFIRSCRSCLPPSPWRPRPAASTTASTWRWRNGNTARSWLPIDAFMPPSPAASSPWRDVAAFRAGCERIDRPTGSPAILSRRTTQHARSGQDPNHCGRSCFGDGAVVVAKISVGTLVRAKGSGI